MFNRINIGMVIGFVLAVVAAGAQGDVVNTFTNRQDVNLMNSYAVTVTPGAQAIPPGIDASNLRSSWLEGSFWDGGNDPTGVAGDSNAPIGTNALTVNFGTTRDLKTINLGYFSSALGSTAYIVETSPDGTSWSTQSSSYTPVTNGGQLVLTSAVDAQYLRVIATALSDPNHRWVVNAMRVFGDTGTLTDPANTLDLVSGTGGPGGGTVTLIRNGSVSETDTTDSQFINDALYPIERQVMFSMGTGDGFTLHWSGTEPIDFQKVGLFFDPAHIDSGATFTIETSTDDVHFETALTQVGGLAGGMNYFTLSPTDAGEYLRFTFTDTSSSDNRISDVQAFGDFVPEPSTAALLGLGGLLSLRRWRRV